MKSTFCVARGGSAYLSAHLGDLDTEQAYARVRGRPRPVPRDARRRAGVIAHDLHPDYLSTRWAQERDARLIAVQHHHAHAAACMAEHGVAGPVLALVFDGTGYGTDGTHLGRRAAARATCETFERVAHLDPVPLPGGEAAIREPWRVAAAYLAAAGRPVPFDGWRQVRQSLAVNAPLSAGMGRLFDAVAALLGVRERVTYEGQAAIELEQLAGAVPAAPYACRVGDGLIRGEDLLLAAHDDLQRRPAARRRSRRRSTRASPWRPPPRASRRPSRAPWCCRAARSRTSGCSPSTERLLAAARASRCCGTGACRPTTAASATGRRRWPRPGCVPPAHP